MLLAQAFAKDGRKLCFNIPRRPSRTDSFYRAGPDHRAEDGFNGRGADVGKNFADIRLGQRRQAVQNGRFHAGFFCDSLAVYHRKTLVQFLVAHIKGRQEILHKGEIRILIRFPTGRRLPQGFVIIRLVVADLLLKGHIFPGIKAILI